MNSTLHGATPGPVTPGKVDQDDLTLDTANLATADNSRNCEEPNEVEAE